MKRLFLCLAGAALALAPAAAAERVRFATNMGDMVLAIHTDASPVTAANFLQYVRDGFYDGTIFHRVIAGFVIQGGGFTAEFAQKPTRDPIVNEARDNGLLNLRYTLSMARTGDPDSATSQFFINLADNAFLDPNAQNPAGYAVFGEVVEGMEIVDAIAAVATGDRPPFQNVPVDDVVVTAATIIGE